MTKATFIYDTGDVFWALVIGGFLLFILGAFLWFSFDIYVLQPAKAWWKRRQA